MKDNLNIEKLFKEKFESFEGNVKPDLWANISKGIASNTALSTGVGFGIKVLLIGASAVAVGVMVYFIGDFNQQTVKVVETDIKIEQFLTKENLIAITKNIEPITTTLIIAEENDPVISENKAEIIKKLSNPIAIGSIPVNTLTDKNNNKQELQTENSDSKINQVSNVDESSRIIESDENISQNTEDKIIETTSKPVSLETGEPVIPEGKIEYLVSVNKFESDSYQVEFRANARDFEKITWDFGDGNLSFKENPKHRYNSVGTYDVKLLIVSEDNYIYTETKVVEIKSSASINNIPNVITPNGDRVNDNFMIKMTNIDEFTITITNQIGVQVFQSNDQDFIWDGTDMSGNPVEKTVYTYYIFAKGNDGTILKIPGQLYVR